MADLFEQTINNLSGHDNFQRFEQFMTVLVRRKWGKHVVKTEDRDGLFDLLVYDDDHSLFAQIECKASSSRSLRTLLKEWNSNKLLERVEKSTGDEKNPVKAILATTASFTEQQWEKYAPEALRRQVEPWSAQKLATMLSEDGVLQSLLGSHLPLASEDVSTHALDIILLEEYWHYKLPIRKIIDESFVEEPFEFGSGPHVIYGPANVGKTCWAIRHAWNWSKKSSVGTTVYLLNASRDAPRLLQLLSRSTPRSHNLIFIIDDIHFTDPDQMSAWVGPYNHICSEWKKNDIQFGGIWISRDESTIKTLIENGLPEPNRHPFPLEKVVNLYRRTFRENWFLVALETRLDPRVAHRLGDSLRTTSLEFHEIVERLESLMFAQTSDELAEIEEAIGRQSYFAYLILLPFGCLNCPVEDLFIGEIEKVTTNDLLRLVRSGLARINDQRSIVLTEHPFQLRQKLFALRNLPERKIAARWLGEKVDAVGTQSPTLEDAVFFLYLCHPNLDGERRCEDKLTDLVEHATWTGVPDPLAHALDFVSILPDSDIPDSIIQNITNQARKLVRTSYPQDETVFIQTLERQLHDWSEQEEHALRSVTPAKHYENTRLDYIQYEIAYIYYLLNDYSSAIEYFQKSAENAVRVIIVMMSEPNCDKQIHSMGVQALARSWISSMLMFSSKIRKLIEDWICKKLDQESALVSLREPIEGICKLNERLQGIKTYKKFSSYFDLLNCIDASWQPSAHIAELVFDPDEERTLKQWIRRHQSNAYIHSMEMRCWPKLYGLTESIIGPESSAPSREYYKSLVPVPDGATPKMYEYDSRVGLYDWATSSSAIDIDKVLENIAFKRIEGTFEYLGDLLLLSLRMFESTAFSGSNAKLRESVGWYIEERLPDVGCNALAKQAYRMIKGRLPRQLK